MAHTVGGGFSAVNRQGTEILHAKLSSYVASPKLTTCCLAQPLTERSTIILTAILGLLYYVQV
jgi:hypothetical protein